MTNKQTKVIISVNMSRTYNFIQLNSYFYFVKINEHKRRENKKTSQSWLGCTSIQAGGPLPDQGLPHPHGGAPLQGEAVAALAVQLVHGEVRGLSVVHVDHLHGAVVGLRDCGTAPDKHKTDQSGP